MHKKSAVVCAHRAAPSGERTELEEHARQALRGSPPQTQLWQQTKKATDIPHAHGTALPESEGKEAKAYQAALPRIPSSGQAPLVPILTTAGLPKPSSMQCTQRPLFQDCEG